MGGHRQAKPLANNPFLSLVAEVKPDIDRRLETLLTEHRSRQGARGSEVGAIFGQAQALTLRGGKRLRAALIVAGQLATRSSRAGNWERALKAGVAVELLQAYFLIHDDWMDQDATRRGGPSVHAGLSKQFRSAHLGACGAILAGDYLVALATERLISATKGHRESTQALKCFTQMQLDAVIGQQLDAIGKSKDAELIYRLKTASYTVSGPLRLGALLSGSKKSVLTRLNDFAIPLGVAFQIRDDSLGIFGDPKRTGKGFANDIKTGKWTWVVQWAQKHGSRAEKQSVKASFGNPQATRTELKRAVAALRSSGAEHAAEQEIQALIHKALGQLAKAKLPERGEKLLKGAASALIDRNL